MNNTYNNSNLIYNERPDQNNHPFKTTKTDELMKTAAREVKTVVARIPEILCFTFESYLLGYKYQELSEMVKVAITSFKTQQDWNFKNWGKRK
jgi:ribosomal protein S2